MRVNVSARGAHRPSGACEALNAAACCRKILLTCSSAGRSGLGLGLGLGLVLDLRLGLGLGLGVSKVMNEVEEFSRESR